MCSLNYAESRDVGHAHFCLCFFFLVNWPIVFFKLLLGNFTDLKLCTQQTKTFFLTKNYQKNFDISKNTQVIK